MHLGIYSCFGDLSAIVVDNWRFVRPSVRPSCCGPDLYTLASGARHGPQPRAAPGCERVGDNILKGSNSFNNQLHLYY